MHIDFLKKIFRDNFNRTAIIWNDKTFTYNWLLNRIDYWIDGFEENSIFAGDVVALIGDFSPETIAILLALIENSNIVVPLNNSSKLDFREKFQISQSGKKIHVDIHDDVFFQNMHVESSHDYYKTLRSSKSSGLVLFTSGTSGIPKGAVHNFGKLLEKFKVRRKAFLTMNFLMFDHWGGLNTLFHTLSNAGVVLSTKDRSPEAVCEFIEKYNIELLPASPTFFNLLLLSEAYKTFDLSSLKLITYGTEPMPEITLKRLTEVFPNIKLQQTYGLIELGVLRSKSKSDNSNWVKIGGDGFELRVVDEILQIKADSAMLGYLNATSPFTEDGWFITGDKVEVDGEYFRILGRKSELINVGGEKVYPQEVENTILELDYVEEVLVYGEKNPLIGNIVCAKVKLKDKNEKSFAIRRIKEHCSSKLENFKVPVKIIVLEDITSYMSERFKKTRQN